MKRILITGGAGFVGHHFVEHFLKNTDAHIVVLDKLSYAAHGFDRLRDIDAYRDTAERVTILSADFARPLAEGVKQEIGDPDYFLHLGAESHVDNSIRDPLPFTHSNVEGTVHLLNLAREVHGRGALKCFFYFSTDEVFGPAPEEVSYKEQDAHNPSNPYAASKSAGEMFVKAYRNTYKLPAIITRSMNIFGERQHPEKFIPKVINFVRTGREMKIHADATRTKAGSRFYIHARNVADAYLFLIKRIESDLLRNRVSIIGEDYHITGEREVDNLELAKLVASVVGGELKYELVDFHSSRPGHDLRYALNGDKIASLGWSVPMRFEDSLRKTVAWSVDPARVRWLSHVYEE